MTQSTSIMWENSAENLSSDSLTDSLHHESIIRRIEDGGRIYRNIISILTQRAKLEERYGRELQKLSNDWFKMIVQSPEYGSTRGVLLNTAIESEKVGQAHAKIGTSVLPDLIAKVQNLMNCHETFTTDQGSVSVAKFIETQFRTNIEEWIDILKNEQKERENFIKMRDSYGKTSPKCKEAWRAYEATAAKRKTHQKMYETKDLKLLQKCQNQELTRKWFVMFLALDLHKTLYPIENDNTLKEFHDFAESILNKADAEDDVQMWNSNKGYAFLTKESHDKNDTEDKPTLTFDSGVKNSVDEPALTENSDIFKLGDYEDHISRDFFKSSLNREKTDKEPLARRDSNEVSLTRKENYEVPQTKRADVDKTSFTKKNIFGNHSTKKKTNDHPLATKADKYLLNKRKANKNTVTKKADEKSLVREETEDEPLTRDMELPLITRETEDDPLTREVDLLNKEKSKETLLIGEGLNKEPLTEEETSDKEEQIEDDTSTVFFQTGFKIEDVITKKEG